MPAADDPERAPAAARPGRRPAPLRVWVMASRPRTLPVAVAPVAVGTTLAATDGEFHLAVLAATLAGAIFIQVGTNLANDYSDARRGADAEERLGPVRVTAGGLVPPRQVLVATWLAYAIAFAAGTYLIAVAGWAILAVGLISILAGVLYTGGPRPYGYEGLGDAFVFLFFGLVAVAGSYYVQALRITAEALALAVPVGLLAAGTLMVNNIRDIDSDRRAGKRTLAVRLGRPAARRLFAATVYGAFAWLAATAVATARPGILLSLAALPLAPGLLRTVARRTDGASLNRALARTALLLALTSLLLAAGLPLG